MSSRNGLRSVGPNRLPCSSCCSLLSPAGQSCTSVYLFQSPLIVFVSILFSLFYVFLFRSLYSLVDFFLFILISLVDFFFFLYSLVDFFPLVSILISLVDFLYSQVDFVFLYSLVDFFIVYCCVR